MREFGPITEALLYHGDEEEQLKCMTPIRLLFAALLERVFRDLHAGSYLDTVSAITWVTCPRKPGPEEYCIPFTLVCETLNLSAERISLIHQAVEKAEVRRYTLAKMCRFKHSNPRQRRSRGEAVTGYNRMFHVGIKRKSQQVRAA